MHIQKKTYLKNYDSLYRNVNIVEKNVNIVVNCSTFTTIISYRKIVIYIDGKVWEIDYTIRYTIIRQNNVN